MSAPAPTGAAAPALTAARARGPSLLTATAFLAAGTVAVPIATVLLSLAVPARDVWAHLWHTQLVELLGNTLGLLAGVGLATLCLGTALAWLVVSFEFPGRRVFEWALVLPLALPAYVMGFVFLGVFDYSGPLQSLLRETVGAGVRLADFRSGWGITLVMTLVLYPYVYTLGRAALLEQPPEALESARSLGRRPLEILVRVTLPLARPALVAGATLACMEALADFGTVAIFGYRTLTEAVYRVWHGLFDRQAATQLAAVLLGLAALLTALERLSRGRARFTQGRRPTRPPARVRLGGLQAGLAAAACSTVLLLGFLLPVGQLVVWSALTLRRDGPPAGFARALGTSVGLASTTAVLTLAVAVVLAYGLRRRPNRAIGPAVRFAALGYALPGAVVAVGVLLPLAALDHGLAAAIERLSGARVGLLLTGTAVGLLFGYVVRFLAVSVGTVEASLARVPRSLDEIARSLGAGAARTLGAVHLPLVRRGLLAAALLVFVDVMKEMPATLLLRPLDVDTLAVAVWQRTAESLWEEAAVPALALVAAGLVPVVLLVRTGGRATVTPSPVSGRAPGP